MKKRLQNLLLLFVSLLISFLIVEFITRLFFPISPGPKVISLEGESITTGLLTPNLQFRQVSTEYNVITTITEQEYRIPEVKGNPDIIFLGDSFTFGVGVSDKDTFVYQYCETLGLSCANLGEPGTGTISQLNRLEKFLNTLNWRPKEVKLFMLAMTSFLSDGNDLDDNLSEMNMMNKKHKNSNKGGEPDFKPGLLEKITFYRHVPLQYSNLLRIIYFYFGPWIKTLIFPKSKLELIDEALEITRQQLIRLDNLSHSYGFEYEIFILHPIQDITRGTYKETVKALERISPVPVQGTAHLFKDDPKRYYYPFDSHLNPLGNRKIAEFLLSRDPRYSKPST